MAGRINSEGRTARIAATPATPARIERMRATLPVIAAGNANQSRGGTASQNRVLPAPERAGAHSMVSTAAQAGTH